MRIPGLRTRDERLADRIANGDTAALETFYNDYYDAIYSFIYYRLGNNHHAAEDIVQNVFFTMITEIKKFKPEKGGLYAWLCGIARHQVIKHLRLNQSKPVTAIPETSGEGEFGWLELLDRSPLPDAVLESKEVKACIAGVLARLPGKYSLVLRQKYMEDLSVDAIAQKWKTSGKAVESMLSRARKEFRGLFNSIMKEQSVIAGSSHGV